MSMVGNLLHSSKSPDDDVNIERMTRRRRHRSRARLLACNSEEAQVKLRDLDGGEVEGVLGVTQAAVHQLPARLRTVGVWLPRGKALAREWTGMRPGSGGACCFLYPSLAPLQWFRFSCPLRPYRRSRRRRRHARTTRHLFRVARPHQRRFRHNRVSYPAQGLRPRLDRQREGRPQTTHGSARLRGDPA